MSDWKRVGTVMQAELHEARLQAHYAAQWLARAARAFVPARPDDGHTSLLWDDAFDGLTTQTLPNGSQLGLRIAGLTLVLRNGADQAFTLDARNDADARAWLGRHLSAAGMDAHALDAPSPYEMPGHPIADGAAYAAARSGDALGELANWYANANASLGGIRQQLAARKLAAPPARCWPHHFDLDTLVSLGGERTVGAGFSPGDEYYDEPYFYVSLYPAPDIAALPGLHMVGHWHDMDFAAAIAPASRIVAGKDCQAGTEEFLRTTVDIALKTLA